jgi:hypothetical protein
MDFWKSGSRRCRLFAVGSTLEVRLYEDDKLVNLTLCRTRAQALMVSEKWLALPPVWPPF